MDFKKKNRRMSFVILTGQHAMSCWATMLQVSWPVIHWSSFDLLSKQRIQSPVVRSPKVVRLKICKKVKNLLTKFIRQ